MSPLSQRAFESVTRLFRQVSGIQLTDAKQALVVGRLQRLAQEAGDASIEAYVDRMTRPNAPAEEMTRLIDRLTTNETYFFREPQHFNDLADRLRAHASQGQTREFLVWSGASSSGEEAYSIAMLMADVLGLQAPWRVIGTDLSTAMVDAARRGLYPLDRARMVPREYLKQFCLKGQGAHEGKLLVAKSLRSRVQFEPANLMQPLPASLPSFDVIFLRNVLIYFDTDAKAAIVRRVMERLRPDGVLYTGHAESISNLQLPLRTVATSVHVHA
ncbi:MAG: methyltransferase domain-containing protein [Burkholderiaceae bacterium]|nr:methyltransferase domain-containing protein [Burkholderiaceae bacterium]